MSSEKSSYVTKQEKVIRENKWNRRNRQFVKGTPDHWIETQSCWHETEKNEEEEYEEWDKEANI